MNIFAGRSRGTREKMVKGLLTLFIALVLAVPQPSTLLADSPCADKKIIGQECWVHVEGLELDFLARVDTGATTTSLHATDYLIRGESDDPLENVGKTISFQTISTGGEYKRMTAEIAKVQTVVNAQGREKRYMVWLTLTAAGVRKSILVNLRDRSAMKHKLLVGRDWLAKDFLVDVDLAREEAPEESEEE
ncbi:MAG: putative ATP-dependent zinc protease [Desulfobulbaceae bacterium]